MKTYFKVTFLLFVASVISGPSFSQTKIVRTVVFQVKSPDLADTSHVFIAGSLPQLGNWNPSKVSMEYAGNKTWRIAIDVDDLSSIEYKFTLGSWSREAADANGQPLSNFSIKVKSDTAVIHTILFWKNGSENRVIKGQVTGTTKIHKGISGNGLKERDVIVWLPPGYEKNPKQHYPVLYMHDGQNIIDPATSSFGVDWQIDESSDSLIRNKVCDPFIVVGIYNTVDRTYEYTPGEGGTAYMKLVVERIKPMIDAQYRTKADRLNTFTGGSSAGGLISFMLAWEYSTIFSGAICMSPAFKIMNIDYVTPVLESKQKKDLFIYIDNGGVGLESQLQPGVDAMINALRSKGYREGKDFVFVSDATAKHFEADWAKRFPKAMTLLMNHARR